MALTTYYLKLQERALKRMEELKQDIDRLPSIDDENLTEQVIDNLEENVEQLENININ